MFCKMKITSEIHFKIYLITLMLIAGFIPLSIFLLSVTMFILVLNWLLEGKYRSKFKILTKSKNFKFFILIYLAHVFWLLNTTDFAWAFHDLRIKLPLLVFPIIIASSPKLSMNHIKFILLTFILAVVINTFISTFILLFSDKAFYNIREISIFISHIRFSLMIVISIGILIYFIFSDNIKKSRIETIIYINASLWLLIFLFILRSFTGVFILMILLIPILLWIKNQLSKKYIIRIINLFTLLLSSFIILNLIYPVYLFYRKAEIKVENQKFNVNGKPYFSVKNNNERENGYLIYSFICNKELEREWNKRSDIKINEKDNQGHLIKATLIRYLTSKGYTKDSLGVSKLKEKEVQLIENGVANYIFGKKFGVYPRIYELLWEIDKYKKDVNPSGHSLTQRIEYLKTGLSIIRSNFYFGVGTGNVPDAFKNQYEKDKTQLSLKSRLRTHNQYVTFFISFGLFGFVIIMISIFYPIFNSRKQLFFISNLILLILMLSMINEDTLETHIGVSLFSFFYSIFIFAFNGSVKADNLKESIFSIFLH